MNSFVHIRDFKDHKILLYTCSKRQEGDNDEEVIRISHKCTDISEEHS
jgi:hypothetical protein